nr:DUF3800 domain-containing protein [Allobranchiibius huperziae]
MLAYLDEIGQPGPFIAPDHPRFNTSPAFGYAGFVIPEAAAQQFGARFAREKATFFGQQAEEAEHPGRFEVKGASLLRAGTAEGFPQNIRLMNALVGALRSLGGELFYYADEKARGTARETGADPAALERGAINETLNRLARHAQRCDSNMMIMMDQINEKARAGRLPGMYSHIFGRVGTHPEMRRVLEPPMHIDSKLSSNIQFADWVAACVGRAIDYQLVETSPHEWVCEAFSSLPGAFTYESKVHLQHRPGGTDLVHSQILNRQRPLYPVTGRKIGDEVAAATMAQIMAAAQQRGTAPTTV